MVLSAGSLSLRGVRGGSEVEKQLSALGYWSLLLAIRVLGAENSDGCGPPFWGGNLESNLWDCGAVSEAL